MAGLFSFDHEILPKHGLTLSQNIAKILPLTRRRQKAVRQAYAENFISACLCARLFVTLRNMNKMWHG